MASILETGREFESEVVSCFDLDSQSSQAEIVLDILRWSALISTFFRSGMDLWRGGKLTSGDFVRQMRHISTLVDESDKRCRL
jgi:hypothetical protein